jgi:hypothetical protein
MSAAQFLWQPSAGLIPSRSRRRAEASRAYASVALGLSRSIPDEFRELAEEALTITQGSYARRPRKSVMASEVNASKMTPMP